MKYGETLHQRSIPQWHVYNVDYNDIKRLIKVRTTKDQAMAIAVPGHDGEYKALQAFEDELYSELREQHQRVALFIKSKSGELSRKLAALEKHVEQLRRRYLSANQSTIPIGHLKRFSKAEEAVLSVGEELQALSRFIGAQQLAFQKLLKKYKKWTGSSSLGERVKRDVLDQPSGSMTSDLKLLLVHWKEILESVRAPFEAGIRWSVQQQASNCIGEDKDWKNKGYGADRCVHGEDLPLRGSEGTIDLDQAARSGNAVQFDIVFATAPPNSTGTINTYWVHNDNLVQLQVLLLQHARMTCNEKSEKSSRRSSHRSSTYSLNTYESERFLTPPESAVDETYCGNERQLARQLGKSSVMGSDCLSPIVPLESPMIICGSDGKEPLVAVRKRQNTIGDHENSLDNFERFPCKRSSVLSIFEDRRNPNLVDQKLQEWLADNKEVEPIVVVRKKRQRFVGFENDSQSRTFVSLDYGISFCKYSSNLSATLPRTECPSISFPHSVLIVRSEGRSSQGLIAALQNSHLVQKVPGFTLEKHAITLLLANQRRISLPWNTLLGQEIRRLPSQQKACRRKTVDEHLPSVSSPSTDVPIVSTFSTRARRSSMPTTPEPLRSPSLIALDKKRSDHESFAPQLLKRSSLSAPMRYWNEFDNGDEQEEDGYYVYVERKSPMLPEHNLFSKCTALISNALDVSTRTFGGLLNSRRKMLSPENEPLIRQIPSSDTSEEDSDLECAHTCARPVMGSDCRYCTFAHSSPPNPKTSFRIDHLFSSICVFHFSLSTILLLVAVILCAERSVKGHRFRTDNVRDPAIIACTCASLITVMVGGAIMLCIKTRFGLATKLAFIILTWLIILGNCVVAAMMW